MPAACIAFIALIFQIRPAAPQASPAALTPLPPMEVRVFGQKQWLRGAPASLRVIVTDHRTGKPLPAHVEISLLPQNPPPGARARDLFTGETDLNGTLAQQLQTKYIAPGRHVVRVVVWSEIGLDELSQEVEIVESTRVELTTDKPIYQPGQTMHL